MTLLLVIVSMIVLTTIIGAMVRQLAVSNQQIRVRNRRAQAGWLAESAIERAAFRLSQDAEYLGEIMLASNASDARAVAGAFVGYHGLNVGVSAGSARSGK